MKNFQSLIILLIAGLTIGSISSCKFGCVHGSGKLQSESRKVDGFSKIEISGGFKVLLKQDSSMSVKITADDNLLNYIHTTVSGNTLKIYSKKNMCSHGEMTAYIGVRSLEQLKASGAVEVQSEGKITTGDIFFKLSGATRVNMDLSAGNITTEGSGITELNLKGQAKSHDIQLSGSGKVHAFDLVVNECSINTSGVSHSELNVLNKLEVQSSGASVVRYRGNPSVSNDKSGASTVEKAD